MCLLTVYTRAGLPVYSVVTVYIYIIAVTKTFHFRHFSRFYGGFQRFALGPFLGLVTVPFFGPSVTRPFLGLV